MNRKTYGLALLAVGLLALALAGCGGGGSSSSASSETASNSGGGAYGNGSESEPVKAAPNAEKGTTFVSLGNVPGLGMVLVDSKGMTLYEFEKDKSGESTCYGACEGFWPPLISKGEPQPSNGADASLVGTTERKDGSMQVTYAGHPLYLFVEDSKPGEANGNNLDKFGAEWYALNGRGEPPKTSSGGGTTTGGGTTSGSGTTTSGSTGYSGY